LTALLFGPGCAGGFCADAVVAANNPIQMKRSDRFIVYLQLQEQPNLPLRLSFLSCCVSRIAHRRTTARG